MKTKTLLVVGVMSILMGIGAPALQNAKAQGAEAKQEMYATVRRYERVPNPAEAAKQVEEKFVPFISSLPGFVEYYWMDLGNGNMMSVTIFKSLSDAKAANEKARAFVKEKLSSVLPRAPKMEAGTIVAHKAGS
jgi:hypothetical protein